MTNPNQPRRDFLRTGAAALAGVAVAGDALAQTQTPSAPAITGGNQSAFPSADAPGSSAGGYNILFILTDQEHYMGPGWPIRCPAMNACAAPVSISRTITSPPTCARRRAR